MAKTTRATSREQVLPVAKADNGRGAGPAFLVYPGVIARVTHHGYVWTDENASSCMFEGFEDDLRRAGLIIACDRLPQGPCGQCGRITMLGDRRLRVMLDQAELAGRDIAF